MAIGSVGEDAVLAIIDSVDQARTDNMGQLRSLPFLVEQGVHRFTFPPHWLRYEHTATFDHVLEESDDGFRYTALPPFAFNYHIIEPDTPFSEIQFQQLCQYTNEGIEEHGKTSITHKILQAYRANLIDNFVLVTNSSRFKVAEHVTEKPLFEKLDQVRIRSYESLAKEYINAELGEPPISIGLTLNIWLHRAAADYVQTLGSQPTRISDLFAFDRLPPSVRTWELLEFLATDHTEAHADHIGATIRPWIESDITDVRRQIHNALQRFEYNAENISRHRKTA